MTSALLGTSTVTPHTGRRAARLGLRAFAGAVLATSLACGGSGSGDPGAPGPQRFDAERFVAAYGGPAWERGASIAVTGDGGYVLAGTTGATVSSFSEALLVVGVGPDGGERWRWTSAEGPAPTSVAFAARAGAVALLAPPAASGDDRDLVVLDERSGQALLERAIEGTPTPAERLVATPSGYVVAGIDGAAGRVWIRALLASGEDVWSRGLEVPRLGGTSARLTDLVHTTDGLSVVSTTGATGLEEPTITRLDPDGRDVWQRTYRDPEGRFSSLTIARLLDPRDGSLLASGRRLQLAGRQVDQEPFLLELDPPSGDVLAWRSGTGDAPVPTHATAQGALFALAGAVATRLDSSLSPSWTLEVPGPDLQDVAGTASGGFALIGTTGQFGAGFDDLLLVRTDAAGATGGAPPSTTYPDTSRWSAARALGPSGPRVLADAASASAFDDRGELVWAWSEPVEAAGEGPRSELVLTWEALALAGRLPLQRPVNGALTDPELAGAASVAPHVVARVRTNDGDRVVAWPVSGGSELGEPTDLSGTSARIEAPGADVLGDGTLIVAWASATNALQPVGALGTVHTGGLAADGSPLPRTLLRRRTGVVGVADLQVIAHDDGSALHAWLESSEAQGDAGGAAATALVTVVRAADGSLGPVRETSLEDDVRWALTRSPGGSPCLTGLGPAEMTVARVERDGTLAPRRTLPTPDGALTAFVAASTPSGHLGVAWIVDGRLEVTSARGSDPLPAPVSPMVEPLPSVVSVQIGTAPGDELVLLWRQDRDDLAHAWASVSTATGWPPGEHLTSDLERVPERLSLVSSPTAAPVAAWIPRETGPNGPQLLFRRHRAP